MAAEHEAGDVDVREKRAVDAVDLLALDPLGEAARELLCEGDALADAPASDLEPELPGDLRVLVVELDGDLVGRQEGNAEVVLGALLADLLEDRADGSRTCAPPTRSSARSLTSFWRYTTRAGEDSLRGQHGSAMLRPQPP